MSYDLVVWRGPRPADDEAAGEAVRNLYEGDLDDDGWEPAAADPSPGMVAFVEELVGHWPDLGRPGDEASPWVSGPLLADARGDLLEINLDAERAEEAREFVAGVARRHDLLVYDPQRERLL